MGSLAGSPLLVSAWVDGRPWAMTVSAFSSISATPPLVMVSLTNTTKVCHQILKTKRLGISALSTDQEHLARRCGTPGTSKFVDDICIEPTPGGSHGEPAIRDAVFNLACSVVQTVPVADHVLIIGAIQRSQMNAPEGARPLLYHDRNYWSLTPNGG
ncbi:flavin reductase family protein [Microbacterium alcoholitolerans]|uniref:flavin reductase family protein n=1 Tax=unclassified Microbacterium TaxID=2609290 RepID=UPI003D179C08